MKICVFGASGRELDAEYFSAAEELGRCIAKSGHALIFGGGREGLMGACARGAAGCSGEITGIAPRFFDEPGILFDACTEFIYTDSMNERKELMVEKADAFIALPGGIGTFEEFFEVLTLRQLGRHGKPIVLLNTLGYYDALFIVLENAVSGGFLGEGCMSLFDVCSTPEEALYSVINAKPAAGNIMRVIDYHK